jgi:hypothetical protein
LLRYDGSNYDAGVPPASFCVVRSRGPPFSVTQLISNPPQLPILEHAVASAAPAASYKSRLHSVTGIVSVNGLWLLRNSLGVRTHSQPSRNRKNPTPKAIIASAQKPGKCST